MSDDKTPIPEDPDQKASGANVNDEMASAFEAALDAVEAVTQKRPGKTEPVEQAAAPTPTPAPARPQDTASAEALAAAEKAVEEWKTRAYRVTADLENTRKRHVREKEDLRKFAIEGLLKEILPVVDNLERAAGHAADSDDPLAQGVRMVLKQFTKVVGDQGAVPFDPAGQLFDPTVHEAMTQVTSEDVAPGYVAQVFQRGWMLNERLLRPAMVIVAAPDSTGSPPEGAEAEEDLDEGDPTAPPAEAPPVED